MSKRVALKLVIPVTIATDPKSQTVKSGKSVVFRVAAKGTAPYTYQWYFNGSAIPKATKSFYTATRITQANAGGYSVIVANQLSSATSTAAVLTVNP